MSDVIVARGESQVNKQFRGKSPAEPLGITTTCVTPPSAEERQAVGRLTRWQRQNVARELLPGERVCSCMRHMLGNSVDVMYSGHVGSAHYKGLMTCGSVWVCPVCAAKITERRRQELSQALEGGEYHLVLATFTFQHSRADGLRELRDYLNDAYRRVIRGAPWQRVRARYGLVGYVGAQEITHGANGWHPHKHVLYICDRELSASEVDAFQSWVSARFERFLAKMGRYASSIHGVQVQAGGDALARYVSKWGLVEELTKSPVKSGKGGRSPFELLDAFAAGDVQAGALFREYAEAMKGSKQLTWSDGLRELLAAGEELSDLELAKLEEEEAEVLVSLTRDQWRVICRERKRGLLLEVASSGRREWVWAFLAGLGLEVADEANPV